MFRADDMKKLDESYFNIIRTGDFDVVIQSKNTGHFWHIHNPEYSEDGTCYI